MNFNLILILIINLHCYLARNYNLTCIYNDFEIGNYIHCENLNLAKFISEYDKCETKSTIDLEYYQCIYKIHQIPTEQATLFGKLHMTILKCKDCEYTRNWKFKNPKLCINKAEAEYYKTYDDCLLNYININNEEIKKTVPCSRRCYDFENTKNFANFANFTNFENFNYIASYLNCSYDCYKDISKKIIEFEPKVTTFHTNSEGNKSNSMSNFYSSSIYSAIALSLIAAVVIS